MRRNNHEQLKGPGCFSSRALAAVCFSLALLAGCGGGETDARRVLQIGVVQFVEGPPSLWSIREGLKEAGFEDGEQIEIDFQSALGDPSALQTIVQQFVGDKKDLIIAIGTPSAQAAVMATENIPIVFSSVPDPVSAGLVKSIENGEGNVTGVSDLLPVDRQLALFEEFGFQVEKLGVIYNTGDDNSAASLERVKAAAEKRGMTVVEAAASSASEAEQAARSLVGQIDGLYLMRDMTLREAYPLVIGTASLSEIPTVAEVHTYVQWGALATRHLDYHGVGVKTGRMAAEILNGKNPAEIPVHFMDDDLSLWINADTAEYLGVEITEQMRKEATFFLH